MAPTSARPPIIVAKSYEDLCRNVVEKILTSSQRSIQKNGRFVMALAGGSTPQGVYSLMSGPEYRNKFDWENIHFFLGDERWVPASSPRSNFKMILDSGIPGANIHAVKTNTPDAETSAALYEKELISFFVLRSGELPRFDLILLGIGQDGHTASLFPGHPALDEKKHFVLAVTARGVTEERITLTLPVIDQADEVVFVVSGSEKVPVLKKIFKGKNLLPAGRVKLVGGKVFWFLDHKFCF